MSSTRIKRLVSLLLSLIMFMSVMTFSTLIVSATPPTVATPVVADGYEYAVRTTLPVLPVNVPLSANPNNQTLNSLVNATTYIWYWNNWWGPEHWGTAPVTEYAFTEPRLTTTLTNTTNARWAVYEFVSPPAAGAEIRFGYGTGANQTAPPTANLLIQTGDGVKTTFAFDTTTVPNSSRLTDNMRIWLYKPSGLNLKQAYFSNARTEAGDLEEVAFLGVTANGTAGTQATTELTLTFDKVIPGLTAGNITLTGATKGVLTQVGDTPVYTLSVSNIIAENIAVTVARVGLYNITPASLSVAANVRPAEPRPVVPAKFPFPQEGKFEYGIDRVKPSHRTQAQMNQDVIDQFAKLIPEFLVDPDPATMNDPNQFRMILSMFGGTGPGITGIGVTTSETTGYGMMMLAKMAGSEEAVISAGVTTNYPNFASPNSTGVSTNIGGKKIKDVLKEVLHPELRAAFGNNDVTIRDFYDGIFRTMNHFPATSGQNSPHHIAWALTSGTDSGGSHRTRPLTHPLRATSGPTTATDGSLDTTYAMLLAERQWGSDAGLGGIVAETHRDNYGRRARLMMNEIFQNEVDRGRFTGGGPYYYMYIGNWVNATSGRLTRPSDFMLQHLRAFEAVDDTLVNGVNRWTRVINTTQAGMESLYAMRDPRTGVLPDFVEVARATGVWSRPGGPDGNSVQVHESSNDGNHWYNSCRVPWRLGTDILVNGHIPSVKALHDNGLKHLYDTLILRSSNGGISGVRAVTFQGAAINSGSGITFASPALVSAAAYGTPEQMEAGWNWARGQAVTSGRGYGAYINMHSMIAASGNWWDPAQMEEQGVDAKVLNISVDGVKDVETSRWLTIEFDRDISDIMVNRRVYVPAVGTANGRYETQSLPLSAEDIDLRELYMPMRPTGTHGFEVNDPRAVQPMPIDIHLKDRRTSDTSKFEYRIPIYIRQPGKVDVEIGVNNEHLPSEIYKDKTIEGIIPFKGEVTLHVKRDIPAKEYTANFSFPQAGKFELAERNFSPTGMTQGQLDEDVINQFKQIIKDFVIDPNPNIVNDPDAFRMVLRHGTGDGLDGGASPYQVTCSESMGYGMMILSYMAGADEHFINNEYARHNLAVVGGRQLTIKDYYDGMYRSLEYWRSSNTGNGLLANSGDPGGTNGGLRSHLMAWEQCYRPGENFFRNPGTITGTAYNQAGQNEIRNIPPQRVGDAAIRGNSQFQGGTSSATDGDLDMAYSLLIADKQFGSEGTYHYRWKAMNMINDMWFTNVSTGGNPALYHLRFGDWEGDSTARSRPSDYLFGHFKAFDDAVQEERAKGDAGINPTNRAASGANNRPLNAHFWQRVADISYDSARQLVALQTANQPGVKPGSTPGTFVVDPDNPTTGLVPDFANFTRNTGIWSLGNRHGSSSILENSYTDHMYNENSTRTPWRYGTDIMLHGDTMLPSTPPRTTTPGNNWDNVADENRTISFSEAVVKPLNRFGYRSSNNKPEDIYFGYVLNGTPKVYDTPFWRGDNRGQGDPSFSSPFLVTAAVFGPQEWMDAGWAYAKTHHLAVNFFAEYINMMTMITASGNFWDPNAEPVASPVEPNAEYTVSFELSCGLAPWGNSPWGRRYVGNDRKALFAASSYADASWYWSHPSWGRPGNTAPVSGSTSNVLTIDNINTAANMVPDYMFGLTRNRLVDAQFVVLEFDKPVVSGNVEFRIGTNQTAYGGEEDYYWYEGDKLEPEYGVEDGNGIGKGGPAHIKIPGAPGKTQFVFDLSLLPANVMTAANTNNGFRLMAKFPNGAFLKKAYLSNHVVKTASITANGSKNTETTTSINIDLGEALPGDLTLTVDDIIFPHLYNATGSPGAAASRATVTNPSGDRRNYVVSNLRIRHPGAVDVIIRRQTGSLGTTMTLRTVFEYSGRVEVHVRLDTPVVYPATYRPFPQAGTKNAPYAMPLLKPTGVTQDQMNQDIIDTFKYRIRDFVIDPSSTTRNEPDHFRMLMKHGPGHGNITRGYDGGSGAGQVTTSESMGYAMVMAAMMGGADHHFIGNEDARFNLAVVGGRQLTLKDYFDGLFRSLNTWSIGSASAPGEMMRWQISHSSGNDFFHSSQAGPFDRNPGGGTATDGDLDMAYACVLAHVQWGSDERWTRTNDWRGLDTESGKWTYNYIGKARAMIDELYRLCIDQPVTNPRYHTKLANSSIDSGTTTTRISDMMLAHFKVFDEIDTVNDWSKVVAACYDAMRQLAQLPSNIDKDTGTRTGLMPDYTTINRASAIWSVPTGRIQENIQTDRLTDENACRVAWRVGTDLLLFGETMVPDAPPLHTSRTSGPGEAYLNASKVSFGDFIARPMNDSMARRLGNDPRKLGFAYGLDGTPKVDSVIMGRNNFLTSYITDHVNAGSYNESLDWKVDRGLGEPCFTSPFMVSAATYGPQVWFDRHWELAKEQTYTINFYGEFINVQAMIIASGNYWNPVTYEPVDFADLTANGNADTTTTQLIFTLDPAIPGLTANNINISGTGASQLVKGVLSVSAETGTAATYTLPVTVEANGPVTVTPTMPGYVFTPPALTTTVYLKAGTPVITITGQPATTTSFIVGSVSGSLSVAAAVTESAAAGYQWFSNTTNANAGGTAIAGATGASFEIPADLAAGTYYYYCVVTVPGAITKTSNVAAVHVVMPSITINTQPAATTNVRVGAISGNLSVAAAFAPVMTPTVPLSYQWFSNTANSNTGGTAIEGATGTSFAIPTELAEGTYFYYCVVSAPGVPTAEPRTSNVATVNVRAPSNMATGFVYLFTSEWHGFNNAAAGTHIEFDVTQHQDVTLRLPAWPAGTTNVMHATHRDIYFLQPTAANSPNRLPVTLLSVSVNGTQVFGPMNTHAAAPGRWLVAGTIGTTNPVTVTGANANATANANAFAAAGLECRTFYLPREAFTIPTGAMVEITYRVGDGAMVAPVAHTVQFMDGDEELSSQEVIAGEKATKPSNPEKFGYTFNGWLFDGEAFDFETPITASIVLVAGWERIPITSIKIDSLSIVTVARYGVYEFSVILNEGTLGDDVEWSIADPSLGYVDKDGTVTIFDRTGNVRLTATDPVSKLSHSITLRIAS